MEPSLFRMKFVAVTVGAIATIAFIDRLPAQAQERPSWVPVWTAKNELQLPQGYREWVYLGSPLTPNALNDGHAGFPEFHNVYVPKPILEEYQKTGKYPEDAIMVKELQLTLPAENPDGSRAESSGRGYFPGAFNGMDVMVKDSKRCAETNNWCFFNFGHHAQPYAATAAIAPRDKCASCHQANADKDLHFTKFYQLLQPGARL